MEVLIATAVGVVIAAATYLLLSRNLMRLILGLVLIGNAANLTIFAGGRLIGPTPPLVGSDAAMANALPQELGRAPCRERVGQDVSISGVAVSLKKEYDQRSNTS